MIYFMHDIIYRVFNASNINTFIFLFLSSPFLAYATPPDPVLCEIMSLKKDGSNQIDLMQKYIEQFNGRLENKKQIMRMPITGSEVCENIISDAKEVMWEIEYIPTNKTNSEEIYPREKLCCDDVKFIIAHDIHREGLVGRLTDGRFFYNSLTHHHCYECGGHDHRCYLISQESKLAETWPDLMQNLSDSQIVYVYKHTQWDDDEKKVINSALALRYNLHDVLDMLEIDDDDDDDKDKYPLRDIEQLEHLVTNQSDKPDAPNRSKKLESCVNLFRMFLSTAIKLDRPNDPNATLWPDA